MEEILKNPRRGGDDNGCVILNFEDNGSFKVKSAYNLSMLLKDNVSTATSKSLSTDPAFWKRCWTLGMPIKIKIFLWRVLQNIIPTKANLLIKGILEDASCPLCGSCDEHVGHLLGL